MSKKHGTGKIALVTGAQRGLGFETCTSLAKLGYTVVLTSMFITKGRAAVNKLRKSGWDAHFHPLDVTSDDDVRAAKQFVLQEFGRLDVLVNNAGIAVDDGKSILRLRPEVFHQVFDVNTLGALRLCQAFVPMMLRQNYGRIVNVASGRGQLSSEDIFYDGPAYNISKTALNALTVMFAHATEGANVLVNSLCPGWCRTDMGGPNAPRSAHKGSETIVWLSTLPDHGPTGGFFRDKHPIPW